MLLSQTLGTIEYDMPVSPIWCTGGEASSQIQVD